MDFCEICRRLLLDRNI